MLFTKIDDSVSFFRIQASAESTCNLHKNSRVDFQWSERPSSTRPCRDKWSTLFLWDRRPTVTLGTGSLGNSEPSLHRTFGVLSFQSTGSGDTCPFGLDGPDMLRLPALQEYFSLMHPLSTGVLTFWTPRSGDTYPPKINDQDLFRPS
jgi:hypothetical protein